MMKTVWKSCSAIALLCALVASALAEETGVALRQDDIKDEPFKDADTVGAIKKGESVSILGKKGGWLNITAAQGTGWVRILSVRKGSASGSAASEIAGIAGVATGRAGTGQVVSTTGVRGLGEEDMKGAKFNGDELKKAEASTVKPDEAKQFASQGELAARPVDWLPEPKSNTNQGR